MKDLSIDIETLGTGADAPVLSIGAALFDRDTGEVDPSPFYRVINLDSAIRGRVIDPGTLAWWLQQSEAARLAVVRPSGDVLRFLEVALQDLTGYCMTHGVERVWGNGAVFDVGILEHAYRQLGLKPRWTHRGVRDLRTVVDAAEAVGFEQTSVPFEGTEHRADHDAVYQARKISAAWRHLTRARVEPEPVPVEEAPEPAPAGGEPWTLVVYPFAGALCTSFPGGYVAYELPEAGGVLNSVPIQRFDDPPGFLYAAVDDVRRVVVVRDEARAHVVADALGVRFRPEVVYGPPGSEGERVGRERGEALRHNRARGLAGVAATLARSGRAEGP